MFASIDSGAGLPASGLTFNSISERRVIRYPLSVIRCQLPAACYTLKNKYYYAFGIGPCDGRSELCMPLVVRHLPSACFLRTMRTLPLSVIGPVVDDGVKLAS